MLYVIATPIGNLEDITLRAIRILGEVDFVLAEDTRKTGMMLKRLNIKKKLISFFEHNEERKIPQIISLIEEGKNVALVSSAGAPTISDPGYKLVRECRRKKLPITSIPGPSSIINALVLTSIAHDKFSFLGYMSRKTSARKKMLEQARKSGITFIFLESPFRVKSTLEDLKTVLGNPKIALIREMTKKFEEVLELNVEEALVYYQQRKPKGEFTIIVENTAP